MNLINYLFSNKDSELYILGTNKYGLSLAKFLEKNNIKVSGFINDFISESHFDTYKIIKSLNSDFTNSTIINCIIEGRTIDAENNIIKLKPKHHDNYFNIQRTFSDDLIEIDYLGAESQITQESVNEVYELLADKQSKNEYDSIINFRKTRDIAYLKKFKFRLQDQYFEDFIELNSRSVFIDGGGFDGATTIKFAQLFPDFKHVYYFEPGNNFLLDSKKKLIDINWITFINKGLWEKTEKLYFDDSLGNASKITDAGKTEIEVISLDDIIKEKIDYIKFDIEGAEINALYGSKNVIKKFKPKLAICVYHNSLDFIRIPKLVLSYNPEYKIYFRHYTQGVCESVMYFV